MTMHPGDSAHRYKGHPKKPKPPKCRTCRQPLLDLPVVRRGGYRHHATCVEKRRAA